MKLSDYKGEQAIDLLADLIDPITEICMDKDLIKEIKEAKTNKASLMQIVKPVLKKHKKPIIEILAAVDGVSPNSYDVNVFTLPAKVLELVNDPEFQNLFTLQSQKTAETSSGSVLVKDK